MVPDLNMLTHTLGWVEFNYGDQLSKQQQGYYNYCKNSQLSSEYG